MTSDETGQENCQERTSTPWRNQSGPRDLLSEGRITGVSHGQEQQLEQLVQQQESERHPKKGPVSEQKSRRRTEAKIVRSKARGRKGCGR